MILLNKFIANYFHVPYYGDDFKVSNIHLQYSHNKLFKISYGNLIFYVIPGPSVLRARFGKFIAIFTSNEQLRIELNPHSLRRCTVLSIDYKYAFPVRPAGYYRIDYARFYDEITGVR